MKDIEILVLYSSKQGSTKALADIICEGIENTPGCLSRLRTVSPISNDFKMSQLPDDGPPYVESKDLRECSGLILGSPTRFGNMCAEMKYFIDLHAFRGYAVGGGSAWVLKGGKLVKIAPCSQFGF